VVDDEKLLAEATEKEKRIQAKKEKRAEDAARVEENIRMKLGAPEVDYNLLEEEVGVEEEMEENEDENFDEDYIALERKEESDRTTIDLELFVAELDRYSIPDRPGAALWNASVKAKEENGVLEKESENAIRKNLTVDRYKIRREREKFRKKQVEKNKEEVKEGIECLGTDGKRNKKTLKASTETVNNVEVQKHFTGVEEHIVYTNEPKGTYVCHSAPNDGTGRGLANDMLETLAELNSKDSLVAICCDGTAVNTGWREGMVSHVERDLERKLLMLSCMLHANELPFRKLFDKSDGNHGTTGPDSFGGEMGKRAAENLHLQDVVKFEQVETNLDDIDDNVSLSRDQSLMYQYIKAVASGEVNPRLATQKAGHLNHSRWLTLAIRLLQLYTRTSAPSDGLRKIVRFIQQVYGPSWFAIKKTPKFTNGPALLFQQMLHIKSQPEDVQEDVKPVVQRNAFVAEPGVMLSSMLESPSSSIRNKALEVIRKLREKPPKKPRAKVLRGIRSHKNPVLQWTASSWIDIIDWKKTSLHLPAIIERLSEDQLTSCIWQPHNFPAFPVHTQSVERAVKLVTEAASKVEGEARRHQFIRLARG